MKRTGNLWLQVLEWGNLERAANLALRGKRHRPDARAWQERAEDQLSALRERLASGDVAPRPAREFTIRDPKTRVISAPCFADRVLHHAIMNVLGSHLERWHRPQSYACRPRKGTHAALVTALNHTANHAWFLQLDVRRFFESIPHDRVIAAVGRKVKDPGMLAALRKIVSAGGRNGRGLPLGSLISQHLANYYLRSLDLYFIDTLRLPAFVRYMDDWIAWSNERARLSAAAGDAAGFCRERLGLELKPPVIQRTAHGVSFLGHRMLPGQLRLTRTARIRQARAARRLEKLWEWGAVAEARLQRRAAAMAGHTAVISCVRCRMLERRSAGARP